jgi:phosphomannomutase/phosphoglucomutase
MVLADSVLAASPGRPVVFDVKCTRRLPEVIRRAGGKPVMSRSGHSMLGQAMRESDAVLGGELSGHLYFRDRWYGFDDALYAGARLLEVLQAEERSPAELFAAYPTGLVTPELRAPVAEGEAHRLMGELAGAQVSGARATTVDGLRLDYPDGWGLVRASNTTPSLVFRFEAEDEAALARIQDAIRGLVHERRPGLELPF